MKRVALSEIAEIHSGGRLGLSGKDFSALGNVPAFGAAGLNGYLDTAEYAQQEGVILSSIGARCGKCFYVNGSWTSLANTQVILPDPEEVSARYLWHILNNEASWPRSGSAQPFIKPSDVKKQIVPLPLISDQRRIAAILDHASRIKELRSRSLGLTRDLQSHIFSSMFGSPASWSDRWPMGTIGDIAASTQYGTSEKSGLDGPTPVLRMGNITTDGQLDTDNLKYMNLADADREKYTVRRGDILFNRTNSPELVGKTAVVRTDDHYAFAGYLIRLRLVDEFEPDFVSGYLNSAYGKVLLRSMCKSIVGQANINAKELRRIPIALPPATVQREYRDVVSRVERHSALLATSDRTVHATLASLQSRAFRGEL